MKLMLKKICVFAMALMIAFTNCGGGIKAYASESSYASIKTVVNAYMEAREKLLKNNNTKKLEKVAVAGIVEDEKSHRNMLDELGIKIKSIECDIENVEDNETYTEVNVAEALAYVKDGKKSKCEIMHTITLMKDANDDWMVVSDSYFEEVTEFISCSYVPEDGGVSTFAVSGTLVPTIVSVADTQVGYKEKASNSSLDSFTANAGSANYTKYGKWYGINPGAWCAMFVSWCANQAGISQTMLPKYASCDEGMKFFRNNGRFYKSSAYKGSYTPKAGDIFFTGPSQSDSTHTGIVVSVSGSTMTIIDGNSNDQVRKRTMSLTNSSLLGFATSCAHKTVQKYNTSYHWNACSVCGSQMSVKTSHSFNSTGKCKSCPATKTSTAAYQLVH